MAKESLGHIDSRIQFRDTFNSEFNTRRLGGLPTDVDYSNGIGSFNGSTSYNNIGCKDHLFKDSFSIRLKIKSIADGRPSSTVYLFGLKGQADSSQSIWCTNEADGDISFFYKDSTNGVNLITTSQPLIDGENTDKEIVLVYENGGNMYIYVDGVEERSGSAVTIDPTLFNSGHDFYVGARNNLGSASNFAEYDSDLFIIYKGALTAPEISNLYENKTYHELPDKIDEQLGSDIYSGWDFSSGWTTDGGVTINDSNAFTTTISDRGVAESVGNLTTGKKYRITLLGSTTSSKIDIFDAIGGLYATGFGTHDFFATSPRLYLRNRTSGITDITTLMVYEIILGTGIEKILDVASFGGVLENKFVGGIHPNIVRNNEFDTDTIWVKGIGWTISGGKATHAAGTASNMSQGALNIFASELVKTTYTISGQSAGNIKIQVSGGGGGGGISRTSNGTYVEEINAGTAGVGNIYFVASSDFDGSLDIVKVEKIVPELINTDIRIDHIDANIYSPDFNAISSKIDVGSYNDLTGNITFLGCINIKEYQGLSDRIFNTNKFQIFLASNNRIAVTNANITSQLSGNDIWEESELVCVAITRTSAGIINFYKNGVLSGTVNQTGDVPVAYTNTITLGSTGTGSWFSGKIPRTVIYTGILSLEQITQFMTNNKRYFK